MAEVGYRFTEMYWAGKDRNWPYARYQLHKIETTLKLGVERRPKRAASASGPSDYIRPVVGMADMSYG